MQLRGDAVAVFQNLMHLSAVPPPEAIKPCWWGDQASALTAAWWSEKRIIGELLFRPHMKSWLSLPPEASSRSSGDHFRPQICMKLLWGYIAPSHVVKSSCAGRCWASEMGFKILLVCKIPIFRTLSLLLGEIGLHVSPLRELGSHRCKSQCYCTILCL